MLIKKRAIREGRSFFAWGIRGQQKDSVFHFYSSSLATNAYDTDAYLGKARVYMALQQYDLAMQMVDAAMAIDTNNVKTYALKAEVFLLKNAYDQAVVFAEKALNKRSATHKADYIKAFVCLGKGEKEKAYGLLDQLAEKTVFLSVNKEVLALLEKLFRQGSIDTLTFQNVSRKYF